MATKTALSEARNSQTRHTAAGSSSAVHAFTPTRAVMVTAWVVAVLLMLLAIAQVAQKQVSKGAVLSPPPQSVQNAPKIYSSNDGSRVADLDPSLTQANYKR